MHSIKSIRLFFSFFFASVLVLAAGCGQQSGDNANSSAQTAEESEDTAASEQETSQASSADENIWKNYTEAYRQFVIDQCDQFVKETTAFAEAIKSGDLAKSRALYAPARSYYERIEPIAEALGELDPNIDAREGDVDDSQWRGFHRIEKGLWMNQSTEGLDTYADQLLEDAKLLRAKVETVEIDPIMLVTGATALLNEVSTSKVTGEEECYSHTDLYDFAANVEGAQKIFEILKPELEKKDPELASTIQQRFADVFQELSNYKKGDGYVLYTELTSVQTKKLSQLIDALAEPLSNMGKLFEGAM